MDRILAESGVSKATLYKHFRSKDELILAVLQQRHHQVISMIEELYENGEGGRRVAYPRDFRCAGRLVSCRRLLRLQFHQCQCRVCPAGRRHLRLCCGAQSRTSDTHPRQSRCPR
ncbi:MAG: TetR/AcrR family transcriptional regulator [Halioglobus sp.]